MKTTNMPGFTAEASLSSGSGHYQQLATESISKAAVHLALRINRGPLGATCTSSDGSSTCACGPHACWAGETTCGCSGGVTAPGTLETL
jgi:hypothetical protein